MREGKNNKQSRFIINKGIHFANFGTVLDMKYLLAVILSVFFCNNSASFQTNLTGPDKSYRELLTKELNLTDTQENLMDSIFEHYQVELLEIKTERDSIESWVDDESQIVKEIDVLNKKKRELTDDRDTAIKGQLTETQLTIFNEKIRPNKPSVLHFGIHNRADCTICKDN